MVSINVVMVVCFAVALHRSHGYRDNNNTFFQKLKGDALNFRDNVISYFRPYNMENDYGCYKTDQPIPSTTEINLYSSETSKEDDDSMLLQGLSDLKHIYVKCQKRITQRFKDKIKVHENINGMKERIVSLYNCMKVFGFRKLDEFLSDDVIPVVQSLEFVRDVKNDGNAINPLTKKTRLYAMDIINKNWSDLAAERMGRLFHGYSLKIRLDDNSVVEGRGRRRDHRMFAMMMMGFVIMASILVPMGFQFLTVLGGKSLLMAKMALIMSAINGLKKIATSNVGYGLYHAPETYHHDPHHHGFHEKIFHVKGPEPPNSPFNVVI